MMAALFDAREDRVTNDFDWNDTVEVRLLSMILAPQAEVQNGSICEQIVRHNF